MPKFCQYCGAPLREDSKFCPSCGHPVAQPNQSINPNPNNRQSYVNQQPQSGYAYGEMPPYQQPPKKKWTPGRIILIVVLVLIVGASTGVYFQYKAGKQRTKGHMEQSVSTMTKTPNQSDSPQSQKKDKSRKSKSNSKIKVKHEDFFGVTLPIPDIGEIIENKIDYVSQNQKVATLRIDKISYQEFIEYCKLLESLPDWKSSKSYNVACFPKDYNSETMIICSGSYGDLSNITVKYFSDELCEDPEIPHFNMSVGKLH